MMMISLDLSKAIIIIVLEIIGRTFSRIDQKIFEDLFF